MHIHYMLIKYYIIILMVLLLLKTLKDFLSDIKLERGGCFLHFSSVSDILEFDESLSLPEFDELPARDGFTILVPLLNN